MTYLPLEVTRVVEKVACFQKSPLSLIFLFPGQLMAIMKKKCLLYFFSDLYLTFFVVVSFSEREVSAVTYGEQPLRETGIQYSADPPNKRK